MPLEAFPGALADPKGYVLFQSFSEHMIGPELTRCGSAIDPRLHVLGGLKTHKHYVRIKP